MVPVFPGHDTEGEEEGGEGSVKVDPTEPDVLPRAQVGEDDGSHKGVGEDDEEEDKEKWGGAN